MVCLNRTILQGDVLEKIKEIPGKSIDVVISSPPYWGLRDYGVEGQLGLEPDFNDYLNTMQKIMDEIKHVLKDTGTCWINLGDTYSGSGKGAGYNGNSKEVWRFDKKPELNETITPKSRVGIPERFYINCIDNGWIARNHIIWTKNNCMPSSVKDRFTNKWESVFFFAKQQKYYFDLDAVREKSQTDTKPFNVRVRDSDTQRFLQGATKQEKLNHNKKGEIHEKYRDRKLANVGGQEPNGLTRNKMSGNYYPDGRAANHPKGKNPGDVFYDKSKPYAVIEREGIIYYRNLPPHNEIREYLIDARKKICMTIDELEDIFDNYTPHHWFEVNGSYPSTEDWKKAKNVLQFDDKFDHQMLTEYPKDASKIDNPKGKNPGDIFQINTIPFKFAHFATFPPALPEKILKCACPKDGIVLDPFFGSGTVGLVAEQLGLNWIGIELNKEYIEIANKRLDKYRNHRLEVFT